MENVIRKQQPETHTLNQNLQIQIKIILTFECPLILNGVRGSKPAKIHYGMLIVSVHQPTHVGVRKRGEDHN